MLIQRGFPATAIHRLGFKLARILNVRERKPFTFCFKQSLGMDGPGQLRGALQRAMTAQGHDMMTYDQAETLRTIQSTLSELAAQVSHLIAEYEAPVVTDVLSAFPAEEAGGPFAAIAPAAAIETTVAGDDFARIKGIDAVVRSLLGHLSITRYADLAAFTADDVQEVGRMLHDAKRISREGWIEQAAVLMTGRETAFSKRSALEAAVVAHVCEDEGEPADLKVKVAADLAPVLPEILSIVNTELAEAATVDAPEAVAAANTETLAGIEALPQVTQESIVLALPPLPSHQNKRRGSWVNAMATAAACIALLAVGAAAYRSLDTTGALDCKTSRCITSAAVHD